MTMPSRLARAAATLSVVVLPGFAQSGAIPWPEFRGPRGDGHAPANARVPLRFSEREGVRWKVPVHGQGWSTPVVAEGRVWLTTATEDGKRMSALAFDLETGEVLVDRVVFENDEVAFKNALNSYASPSPVAGPGRVWVHFGTYGTACLDARTGETIWERRDLRCDHMQGPGSSPILLDDLLVFDVDGGDVQYVIALDAATGRTRWRTPRSPRLAELIPDRRKAYGTPIVVEVDGARQIVSTGAEETVAYDPATGEEIWKVRHPGFSMASRAVVGEGMVFLTTGYVRPSLLAVRLGGHGDVTDSHVAWRWRRGVPTMPSLLFHDGRLYFVSNGGIATCLRAATGEPLWRKRLGGEHCASPLFAAGHVWFFDREGSAFAVRPADRFELAARNRLENGFMASAAVAQDAWILRTTTHLYRIEAPRPVRAAGDWPGFRGPGGQGHAAPDARPPLRFDAEHNVRWKARLPRPGNGSPIVVGDRVLVTSALDAGGRRRALLCFDRASGERRWTRVAEIDEVMPTHRTNPYGASTPASDGRLVVVWHGSAGLFCYDLEGRERWRRDLGEVRHMWGYGASPVIHDGKVVVHVGPGARVRVVALDLETGEERWSVEEPIPESGNPKGRRGEYDERGKYMGSWSTPVVAEVDGRTQVLCAMPTRLVAYDLETGEVSWWCEGLRHERGSLAYSSPVLADGLCVQIGGFRGPGIGVRLGGGRGDVTPTHRLWRRTRFPQNIGSGVFVHGHVFVPHAEAGQVECLDPRTGERRWRERAGEAALWGSIVHAAGRLYVTGQDGVTLVLRPSPERLEVLARNPLGEGCNATPAVAGDALWIRTDAHLWCLAEETRRNATPERDGRAP